MVLEVVPGEVVGAPARGMGAALEASGVVGLILLGFEGALAEGVVVAHARAAVAGGDAQLAQKIEVGVGDHRGRDPDGW